MPTAANVAALRREVGDPKFSEYHVYFSNVLPGDALKSLAEADEHEVVQQVQEYFADFLAINPDLASLGIPSMAGLYDPSRWDQPTFDRTQQGIGAVLLALKKRPLIRYNARSEMANR